MLDVPIAPRNRASALFEQAGVPYRNWDADMQRQRVPGLDPGRRWPPKRIDDDAFWRDATDELGAVFTPDGGFIDNPMLATQNRADAASQRGARFAMMITAAYDMDPADYSVPYVSTWASTVDDTRPVDVERATGELVRKTALAILNRVPGHAGRCHSAAAAGGPHRCTSTTRGCRVSGRRLRRRRIWREWP